VAASDHIEVLAEIVEHGLAELKQLLDGVTRACRPPWSNRIDSGVNAMCVLTAAALQQRLDGHRPGAILELDSGSFALSGGYAVRE